MPFEQVYLSYARWISNNKGQAPGDDVLVVQASADGGSSWITLERPGESLNSYRMPLFLLDELLPPTRTLQLRMIASDLGEGSLVEALIDDVLVIGVPLPDGDADGFPDVRDNCPVDSNTGQLDTDVDTVGDVCDCAPVNAAVSAAPSAVEQLRVSRNPREGTVLEWDVPEQTASQDVITGNLTDLRSSASYAAASCLLDGIAAPPAFDTAPDPAAGTGVYYLVRATNTCGGTFGDSGIKPDPRDALLDSSVCP